VTAEKENRNTTTRKNYRARFATADRNCYKLLLQNNLTGKIEL
jgi:hypothetical protein